MRGPFRSVDYQSVFFDERIQRLPIVHGSHRLIDISPLHHFLIMSLPDELRALYTKQKYGIVGRHSAVKTCHWQSRSLNTRGEENCYKNRFYGVPTHRCIQMTPSMGHCTQSCLFCWRATPETLGVGWEQTQPIEASEDPDSIIDGCIETHRKQMSGFGGNPNVDREMWKEACDPVHAAISLEGEPTLYPRIGELVDAYKSRGFKSVFIVTNGTTPEVLSALSSEPSQLYISLCAQDRVNGIAIRWPRSSTAWREEVSS